MGGSGGAGDLGGASGVLNVSIALRNCSMEIRPSRCNCIK